MYERGGDCCLWAGIEIMFTVIVAKLVDGSGLICSDMICDLLLD
jgi:hypothetical protein